MQFMGLQRVRHDLATKKQQHGYKKPPSVDISVFASLDNLTLFLIKPVIVSGKGKKKERKGDGEKGSKGEKPWRYSMTVSL